MNATTRVERGCVLLALAAAWGCGSSSGGGSGAGEPVDGSVADVAAGGETGSGSSSVDGGAAETSTGGDASPGSDGGVAGVDAAGDAGPCPGTDLECGGVCVPNDTLNCGSCGNDCTTHHVTSTIDCIGGACSYPGLTCAAGWASCGVDAGPGCDTDLSQAAHCGSCSNACVVSPVCNGAPDAYACLGPVAIAAASIASFAVMSDGTIRSWGSNSGYALFMTDGLLGAGDSAPSQTATPLQVMNITTATAVAAGDGHACALLADETVACWGDNTYGQLGTDANTTYGSTTPIAVAGLSGVIAIAAGEIHTCALLSGGTVECWGADTEGELGSTITTMCNGTDVCSSSPLAVPGLTGVTAIAIGADDGNGADHTCALLSGGAVECWGYNQYGELGIGSKTTAAPYGVFSPTPVAGLTNAIGITAWWGGGCALVSGGTVECWGLDDDETLGEVRDASSDTPLAVMDVTGVTAISVGPVSETVCAVLSSGAAKCWGLAGNGTVGNGAANPPETSGPVSVVGLTDVTAIAAGAWHVCALSSGNVYCWGANMDYQLGNSTGDPNVNSTPSPVQW